MAGYGLGAYQTRQLVREMGGRLEVNSEVGHGTIMRVVLPVQGGASDMEPVREGLGAA